MLSACLSLLPEPMMEPIHILEKFWGYTQFREPQDKIVQSVLDGKDTLALLPTGGGKSICFQVPGMMRKGITIVVSPLISLMKDQVANLRKRGIKATAIYSGMPSFIVEKELEQCVLGHYKFLYVSPERLKTFRFIEAFKAMEVGLLAIDEAHCISQWGYDFRPVYLDIAEIREYHPKVTCLALTATATPQVAKDICDKLGFPDKKNPNIIGKSFARNNLYYVVSPCERKEEKIMEWLKALKGTAIVYTRNRKNTERFAAYLNEQQISADFYHAGLDPDIREEKQQRWMNNLFRVMVATNAFGMGIDKPDVRLVLHTDVPESPEAYFQEAGRGGRDGKAAYAVLPVVSSDKALLERRLSEEFPPKDEIVRVYKALCNFLQIPVGAGLEEEFKIDLDQFSTNYKLNAGQVFRCLKLLEKEGYIYFNEANFEISSLHIKMGVRALYDFMVRNPKFQPFIEALIRSYGGTFEGFVRISEHKMAARLKISVLEMMDYLQKLDKLGVWEYKQSSSSPSVIFTMPRLPEADITLDSKIYGALKKNAEERYGTMIRYIEESDTCRSRVLLRYFGETETSNCGHCDVCRKKNETSFDPKERLLLIKQKVKESGIAHFSEIKEILTTCGLKNSEANRQLISMAVDEGVFQFDPIKGYHFLI